MNTITKFFELWERRGFEIAVFLCILFILICVIVNWNKKGTWYKYILNRPYTQAKRPRPRDIPSENIRINKPPKESKGERECRRVLENLFKRPFPNVRPSFLRNPVTSEDGNENNLELDCFNAELKLAVEMDGIFHRKYSPFFHKTKDAFYNQKYRDFMKDKLCQENGITLIRVADTVKTENIEEYLISELEKKGFLNKR